MRTALSILRATLARHPATSATLATLLVHTVLIAPFSLTFLADDYHWLALGREPGGLDPAALGTYWSRVPVWAAVTWLLFDGGVWEASWLPVHAAMGIHAAGVAVIVRAWIEELRVEAGASTFVVVAVLAALHPNAYEMLYWPTCVPYVLGTAFLAGALLVAHRAARIVLLALAMLTSETFVLPALALTAGPAWLRGERGQGPLWRWGAAVAAYAATRAALAQAVGPYAYSLSWEGIGTKGIESLESLFLLHFYRVNWGLSAAALLGLAAVLWLSTRAGGVRPGRAFAALGLAVLSSAPTWLLEYGASRALYGSLLVLLAAVGWLLCAWMQRERSRATVAVVLSLLGGAFVAQRLVLLSDKDHNARVLERREAQIAARIAACAEPCVLEVGALDAGLKRDWVLPPGFWRAYVAWIQARHAPGKPVEVRIRSP